VQRASGWRADLATRVREAARDELRAAGLLTQEEDRLLGVVPRRRWRLTPSGRAWCRSAADASAAASVVLPATGLLLVLDQELRRRLRDAAGVEVPAAWGDADGLDAVLVTPGRPSTPRRTADRAVVTVATGAGATDPPRQALSRSASGDLPGGCLVRPSAVSTYAD